MRSERATDVRLALPVERSRRALRIPGVAPVAWGRSCDRGLHFFAVIGYAVVAAGGVLWPPSLIIGASIFLLATAIPMIWQSRLILMISIGVGVLSYAFPPLAPLAAIVVICLWIWRFAVFMENIAAVVAGLLAYGFLGAVWVVNESCVQMRVDDWRAWAGGAALVALWYGFWFDRLLRELYAKGYTTARALGWMGAVPLVLATLILPLLKLHFGADHHVGFDSHGHGPGFDGHGAGGDIHGVDAHHGPGDVAAGTHHADLPAPKVQYVPPHLRTDPDGILQNNLSYHGEGKLSPGPVHEVHGYFRSTPGAGDLPPAAAAGSHAGVPTPEPPLGALAAASLGRRRGARDKSPPEQCGWIHRSGTRCREPKAPDRSLCAGHSELGSRWRPG